MLWVREARLPGVLPLGGGSGRVTGVDMAGTTETFVMSLETLYWTADPVPEHVYTDVHVWPVFFKIDGGTASVSDAPGSEGKLMGTATISGTTGAGPVCRLEPGISVAVPAEVGQRIDQVVPIPFPSGPKLGLDPDIGGIFGVALVIVQRGELEADILEAGQAALNDSLQNGLDDLIANHPAFQPDVGPDEIKKLTDAVDQAVDHAIHAAMDVGDWLHQLLSPPKFGKTFARFSQDQLPAADFDQNDFDPASDSGPALFEWLILEGTKPIGGFVGLGGAISRSRRNIGGQGVIGHFHGQARAVAGFTSPDGFQHAIAATDDGTVTEMYWQGSGQPGSGTLTQFSHPVTGLAGYTSADGYQHAIVATGDGTVTELYWQGTNAPSQDTLSHFDSRILAIAGYSASDGSQHVIVATDDGNLTELYWQTGDVGRDGLTRLDSHVVDLAGYEAHGIHHVIAATADGILTELTWSGTAAATARTLAQVEAQPWNHVLGVAAYEAAWEQHVIVGMTNGTLREFHTPLGDDQSPPPALHTDLAATPGIVPVIDAYAEADGDQHTIFATEDGDVHELWWSPAATLILNL